MLTGLLIQTYSTHTVKVTTIYWHKMLHICILSMYIIFITMLLLDYTETLWNMVVNLSPPNSRIHFIHLLNTTKWNSDIHKMTELPSDSVKEQKYCTDRLVPNSRILSTLQFIEANRESWVANYWHCSETSRQPCLQAIQIVSGQFGAFLLCCAISYGMTLSFDHSLMCKVLPNRSKTSEIYVFKQNNILKKSLPNQKIREMTFMTTMESSLQNEGAWISLAPVKIASKIGWIALVSPQHCCIDGWNDLLCCGCFCILAEKFTFSSF